MKKKTGNSGFTMTEMLIGVGVMAVMGSIAVGHYLARMPYYRLNESSRQIMTDLRLARMQSVSQKALVQIKFNSERKDSNTSKSCFGSPSALSSPQCWCAMLKVPFYSQTRVPSGY